MSTTRTKDTGMRFTLASSPTLQGIAALPAPPPTGQSSYPTYRTPVVPLVPTSHLFGIGTYQPVSGGTVSGGGFSTQHVQLVPPGSGVYGGTYGYVLDTTIRQPQSVQYVPANSIGLDASGVNVVRGYPSMTWNYNEIRPDYWYYLQHLFEQAGKTPLGFEYLVLLQYPDPRGSGQILQTLARWNPPTHSSRTQSVYQGVVLSFSYLGQVVLNANVPIVVQA